ncbi:MAG: lamin tail domain-containing protein [Polyangiaceae bacterium]|nr:lamin tail domain-containing protein [Polyangiaceae bacterium]
MAPPSLRPRGGTRKRLAPATPLLALGIIGFLACSTPPDATFTSPSVLPNTPGTSAGGASGTGGVRAGSGGFSPSLGGSANPTPSAGGNPSEAPSSGGGANVGTGGVLGAGGTNAGPDTGGSNSATGGNLGASGGATSTGGNASGGQLGLGGSGNSSGGNTASGGTSGGFGTGGAQALMPKVVINEIRGNAPDFVELYNAGNAVANLSGYLVTDTNSDEPDLANPFVFPNGTLLQPGHYVVLLAVSDNNSSGPLSAAQCEDVGEGCYKGTFAVSNSGETIYLFNSSQTQLDAVDFPADVTTSYGRRPNGTGNFSVTPEVTPGASNP